MSAEKTLWRLLCCGGQKSEVLSVRGTSMDDPPAPRRDLALLPKAHLRLQLQMAGRQKTWKRLYEAFTTFCKGKAKKFGLAPDGKIPKKVTDGMDAKELAWLEHIRSLKKEYDDCCKELKTCDEESRDKIEREKHKAREKYEALFHGLEWKDLTESSPDAISAAPLYFSGFTHLTAMQQAVVDNFPLGQNLAREMIIFDLCRDAEAEGIRWMELSVSVQGEKESWVGLCESLDRAFHEYPDVGVGIVLCISRSSSPEEAEAKFDAVIALAQGDADCVRLGLASRICAVGLLGNEAGDPKATKFGALFARCASEMGWPPVPHAGAMTGEKGPEAIIDALDVGAKRIGHGILAMNDSESGRKAVVRLREAQVCCEVCPVSNVHLCDACFGCEPPPPPALEGGGGAAEEKKGEVPQATFRFADHPLPRMLDAGIPCCLNGDDPATFGAPSSHGLLREFEIARSEMRLSDGQLAECARSSFVHALGCPEAVRDRALADIEAWLRGEDLATAAAAAQSSSSQKPKTPRFKRGQKKSFSFLASHAHGGRI